MGKSLQEGQAHLTIVLRMVLFIFTYAGKDKI